MVSDAYPRPFDDRRSAGATERAGILGLDPLLFLAALGLIGFSLFTLKAVTGGDIPHDPYFYVLRQAIYAVLGITVMRRIWYAQIVSLLGDFLALFAVISVVSFKMHGTASQVTGVQIAYMLPLALLGPLAGVFVDRWPTKPTLVGSDLIRAAL